MRKRSDCGLGIKLGSEPVQFPRPLAQGPGPRPRAPFPGPQIRAPGPSWGNQRIYGPNRNMAEHRSDYNEFGRNQVGSNPPDEPHISEGGPGAVGGQIG